MNMITYVFPGQGSQSKGMGKELFKKYPQLVTQADDILGYSITELCLEDPEIKLGETQYTQTALFIVNALSYLEKLQENQRKPDYVAGHSLGEYNALFASGAFDFATGLKLVQKRGELMSLARGGGMAAVIGLKEAEVKKLLMAKQLTGIDVANCNSPYQIVISGLNEDIQKAKSIFSAVNDVKMVIPLKVSGAFHSRYMENARTQFEQFIDSFTFLPLTIPVISNVYARPYKQACIKQWLLEQFTQSVKWTETIRYLMGKGSMTFEEVGIGKVLTGMIKKIQSEATPLIVHEELENVEKNNDTETTCTANTKIAKKIMDSKQERSLCKVIAKNGMLKGTKTNKNAFSNQNKPLVFSAESLGSLEFKKEYNVKLAYLSGGMYRGIASKEIVVKMAKAGLMSFFGSGGLDSSEVERAIRYIKNELRNNETFGMNLLHNPANPGKELEMVNLYLRYEIQNVEAAAYMVMTPALVKFRIKGLKKDAKGNIMEPRRIIGKISRPEIAELFLSPPPKKIIDELLQEGQITEEEADLAKRVPMSYDLCVEADSGGHTDQGIAYALMPAMLKLRDEMMEKYNYNKKIRIGAAGGIGTPHSALAAFMLGADFIVTGSINQCTVEAGTSDRVKDLLQEINVQDTDYAPAGDMFELGAKVQVLKRGVFFPARANKLFELYRQHKSLDEIDEKTKLQIQEKYFQRSFADIYKEIKDFYPSQEIERAEQNPKHKMALIFRWYFKHSTQLALAGNEEGIVNYQVHCGPALGSFNQWVKGTKMENWRNRHVDEMGVTLMKDAATLLNQRIQELSL